MKRKKSNIISFIFFLVLLGATSYLFLKSNDIDDIFGTIKMASGYYILLCFLMVIIFFLAGAYVFKIILDNLRVKSSIWKCCKYVAIDFYFAAITPSSTGGQPAGIYYMSKDLISPSKATFAFLLISALYKIMVLVLGAVFFIIQPNFITLAGPVAMVTIIIGIIVSLFLLFCCFFLMFAQKKIKTIVLKIIKGLSKIKIVKNPELLTEKLDNYLVEYKKSAIYIKENKMMFFSTLFYTFIQRIALYSVSYFVYKALGFSGVYYIQFLIFQTSIDLAMACVPLPGGIGAAEMMFLAYYSSIYTEVALVPAMLLTRGFTHYLCLIFSSLVTIGNQLNILRKNRINERIISFPKSKKHNRNKTIVKKRQPN